MRSKDMKFLYIQRYTNRTTAVATDLEEFIISPRQGSIYLVLKHRVCRLELTSGSLELATDELEHLFTNAIVNNIHCDKVLLKVEASESSVPDSYKYLVNITFKTNSGTVLDYELRCINITSTRDFSILGTV